MPYKSSPSKSIHQLAALFTAIFFAILLTSCAIFPDLGPLPQVNRALTYGDTSQEERYAFPEKRWWESYQDPLLTSLIEEGLIQSPSLAEAAARLKKANAESQVAGAPLYPTLDANGSYQKYRQSYNNGSPPSFVPHGFQDSTSLTLNFNYEIDFWGKNREQLKASLSEAAAAKIELDLSKTIVSTSIASAYAELTQLYAELDEAQNIVQIRNKLLNLHQDLFSHGLENKGGIDQARTDIATAEADVVTLEEEIQLKKINLAALLGAPPTRANSILRPTFFAISSYGAPTILPSNLIAQRADLIAARIRLEAAAHRINQAKTGYYPNVNLAAYIGLQSLGLDLFFKKDSMISAFGPSIYLPLFKGGQIEGNYRGARADYEISLAQYESSIIQALQEVANAIASQKSQAFEIQKIKDAVAASKSSYQVELDRYKGGIANNLDVLQSEEALVANRRNLITAQTRAFILDVALVKALGGGFQPIAEKKEKQ